VSINVFISKGPYKREEQAPRATATRFFFHGRMRGCVRSLLFVLIFVCLFLLFYGDEWVVGEESSSAGYGREAEKRMYLCHGCKAALCNAKKTKESKKRIE
jgi:hypothetical protein